MEQQLSPSVSESTLAGLLRSARSARYMVEFYPTEREGVETDSSPAQRAIRDFRALAYIRSLKRSSRITSIRA